MTGRTHLMVGALAGIVVSQLHHDQALIVPALVGALGGILPDIDHPQSMISGFVPGSGLIHSVISHRGPTHTLLFLLIVIGGMVAAGLPGALVVTLAAGMVLHLLCDMATPRGVRLLMPLHYGAWRLLPGGVLSLPGAAWALETLVAAGALVGIVAIAAARML